MNKNEYIFLSARAVSYLGNKLLSFSLAFLVLNKTGKAIDLAILYSIGILPEIIFNYFGGISGDYFNKKKIYIISDMLGVIILTIFLLILDLKKNNYIYIISFLKISLSFIKIFVAPAIDGIIPEIITKNKLLKFNAKYTIILDVVDIISPFLAGYLYLKFDLSFILKLDILSFIISSSLYFFIKYDVIDNKVMHKIKKNFFSVYLDKKICTIIIENFIISLILYPFLDILIIYYFSKTLGFSNLEYGRYQSIIAFLSILLTLILFKYVERIKKNNLYIFTSICIIFLILGRSNIFYLIIFFVLIDNISKFFKIKFDTSLQTISPITDFSKISSIYWTTTSVGVIFGNIALSYFLDKKLEVYYYLFLIIVITIIIYQKKSKNIKKLANKFFNLLASFYFSDRITLQLKKSYNKLKKLKNLFN